MLTGDLPTVESWTEGSGLFQHGSSSEYTFLAKGGSSSVFARATFELHSELLCSLLVSTHTKLNFEDQTKNESPGDFSSFALDMVQLALKTALYSFQVHCVGNETTISSCPNSGYGSVSGCKTNNAAGVICFDDGECVGVKTGPASLSKMARGRTFSEGIPSGIFCRISWKRL